MISVCTGVTDGVPGHVSKRQSESALSKLYIVNNKISLSKQCYNFDFSLLRVTLRWNFLAMTNKENTLEWIQALRGVAVLLVVLTHARYYFLDTPLWGMAENTMRAGAMGVDLFFVISGFIMALTTFRSDGSPAYVGKFAIKRFARIWPSYMIVTLVWGMANHGGLAFFQDANNRTILFKSLAFIPAVPSAPPYFGVTLPLGWTLEFEMYFYAVFAVSMLFKRLRWFMLAAWMVLTVLLIPMQLGELSFDVLQDRHYTYGYLSLMTSPLVLEFLAGVVIALLYRSNWIRIPSVLVCANLVGLSVGFVLWYAYGRIGDFHGPTKWGWPIALMVAAMAIASKTIVLPTPRVLLWFGTISYSLYLTHTTTQFLVTSWMVSHGYETHTWTHILLTSVMAITVASFCYRYLEQGLSERVRDYLLHVVTRVQSFRLPVGPRV
jgi:exopolysaccharide production protein ExoZ